MAVKKAAKKKAAKKAAKKAPAKKKTAKKAPAKKKVAAKKKAAPKKKAAVKKKAAPKKKASPAKKTAAPKKQAAASAPKRKKALSANQEKYKEIREKLVQQKNELLTEAESAMNALPEQTVFPDLGDQASAETDRNFMLRLRGREQRLLNKIEETIERIDNDNFGVCEACGEEIGYDRLMARPVASLCIECKLEQEEEEKIKGK